MVDTKRRIVLDDDNWRDRAHRGHDGDREDRQEDSNGRMAASSQLPSITIPT